MNHLIRRSITLTRPFIRINKPNSDKAVAYARPVSLFQARSCSASCCSHSSTRLRMASASASTSSRTIDEATANDGGVASGSGAGLSLQEVQRRVWKAPERGNGKKGGDGEDGPRLRVLNSLTRSKDEFVTRTARHVSWYNCGPTVYDASHMGHARNYVTQDILRRIMSDYFGYDVHFVMNVTDIDDKIIVRARQQELFKQFKSQALSSTLSQPLIDQISQAWKFYYLDTVGKVVSSQDQTAPNPSPAAAATTKTNGTTNRPESTEEKVDKYVKAGQVQAAVSTAPAGTGELNLEGGSTSVIGGSSGGGVGSTDADWKVLLERTEGGKADEAYLKDLIAKEEKFGMWMTNLKSSRVAIDEAVQALGGGRTATNEVENLVDASRDVLSSWLDKEHGSEINDLSIFRSLAAYWEQEFFNDMDRLHVLRPNTLTRVSEYVPEIVSFIDRIIQNGYAYVEEGVGNVWFDVESFDGSKGRAEGEKRGEGEGWNHTYAKLQPWSKGNKALQKEGEGSLLAPSSMKAFSKRSPADFALWKASKPGEPWWSSPWGKGRPGWHIECSVMATEVLGEGMDIHSGGSDLMFPHHDNEIAQSEAYHGCHQWVNYFLHTGHLHIEGLKMSKSLKNFITIDDALQRHTARQIRLLCLLALWNARMDFKEAAMLEVRTIETTLNNFFTNVKALVSDQASRGPDMEPRHRHHDSEKELITRLKEVQTSFRAALSDSFNTPEALLNLLDIVSKANTYITKTSRKDISVEALLYIEGWVTKMLRMFGLGEGPAEDSQGRKVIGWGQKVEGGDANVSMEREDIIISYVRELSNFRDSVRNKALEKSPSASQDILSLIGSIPDQDLDSLDASRRKILEPYAKVSTTFKESVQAAASAGKPFNEFLALCDRLRDQELVDLGVALDDQDDGRALVKLVPAEILLQAREEKLAAQREKASKKAAAQEAAALKKRQKLEKGRTPPEQFFKTVSDDQKEEWGAFDDKGIPTHEKDGKEVSKKGRKKLEQRWNDQEKLHKEFLAWQAEEGMVNGQSAS